MGKGCRPTKGVGKDSTRGGGSLGFTANHDAVRGSGIWVPLGEGTTSSTRARKGKGRTADTKKKAR